MRSLALFGRLLHLTNFLVCTATAGLCFQTSLLLDWIFIPGWFYLLMFSSTFLLFGVHALVGKHGSPVANPKPDYFLRHKNYFILFTMVCLLVSGYLCFKLTRVQGAWLIVMGLLTIAGSFLLLLFKSTRRVKHYTIFNLMASVILWTFFTTVIPATFIPFGFDTKFWWMLVSRFFYLLAIFIPLFTWNNMADIKSTGRTQVSALTNESFYKLSYTMLVISALSLVPAVISGISTWNATAFVLSLVITAWIIKYTSKHRYSPDSYLLQEGSMILQTMLICVAVLIP